MISIPLYRPIIFRVKLAVMRFQEYNVNERLNKTWITFNSTIYFKVLYIITSQLRLRLKQKSCSKDLIWLGSGKASFQLQPVLKVDWLNYIYYVWCQEYMWLPQQLPDTKARRILEDPAWCRSLPSPYGSLSQLRATLERSPSAFQSPSNRRNWGQRWRESSIRSHLSDITSSSNSKVEHWMNLLPPAPSPSLQPASWDRVKRVWAAASWCSLQTCRPDVQLYKL